MDKHELTQEDRDKGNKKRWEGHQKTYKKCLNCGKEFRVFPRDLRRGKGKFCSQECANEYNGKKMVKPRQEKSNGYIYLKTYDHPNRMAQNLIAEHRVVVENEIGRYLTAKEVVHHIDEDKHNNEIGNLYLCRNRLQHKVAHVLNPESLRMLNLAMYSEWESFKDFDLLKGVQGQLQDMLPLNHIARLSIFVRTVLSQAGLGHFVSHPDYHQFKSMEQLWLAFVMKEKFNKVWNGEDWVVA